MGLWYVFLTFGAIFAVADFGFSPTLARNVSYAVKGAEGVKGWGLPGQLHSGTNQNLLHKLDETSKRIYSILTLAVASLGIPAGLVYISLVNQPVTTDGTTYAAWVLFGAGAAVTLYCKRFLVAIQGFGNFYHFYTAITLSNAVFVLVAIAAIQGGGGLFGAALGYLLGSGTLLVTAWAFSSGLLRHVSGTQAGSERDHISETVAMLWRTAWRSGIASLGAFLILRANVLVVGAFIGLTDAGNYGITLQLFSVIAGLSSIAFFVRQADFAHLRLVGDRPTLRRQVWTSYQLSVLLFVVGSVATVLLAPTILSTQGRETLLLSQPLTLLVALMIFLEMLHTNAALVVSAGNEVPYWISALVSGLTTILLSLLGVSLLHLGIAWVVVSQLVVQLAYNNWKWPWEVWGILRRSD